jgi:hypothetical protein
MGALAQLSESTLDVEPGRSTTITMTVRNNGTVVDRYSFEALGIGAAWMSFSPASLSLFPDASGTVNVVFSPPRDPTVAAGPTPFAVRVVSAEDAAGSVVEEGTVTVGGFSDLTVELVPRIARGRISARTQVAVDNRSNCAYRAELSGSDPKSMLGYTFRPSSIDVAPGTASFVKLSLRPASRFWRGTEKTHSFRVVLRHEPATGPAGGTPPGGGVVAAGSTPPAGSPAVAGSPPGAGPASSAGSSPAAGSVSAAGSPLAAGGRPPTTGAAVVPKPSTPHKEEIFADGSMLQEPILPRWLLAAAAALVALAVLLVILWFALAKPQIKSTAQQQVNKQLTANGITTSTTTPSGKASTGSGGGNSSSPGGSAGGSGGGTSTNATTPASTGGSTAASATSTVNESLLATGNGTYAYSYSKIRPGSTLEVTDILVENSAGDVGNMALEDDGHITMEWSMANFRDLDYHWITPILFNPGQQLQLVVSGCSTICTPGIYFAGHLVGG